MPTPRLDRWYGAPLKWRFLAPFGAFPEGSVTDPNSQKRFMTNRRKGVYTRAEARNRCGNWHFGHSHPRVADCWKRMKPYEFFVSFCSEMRPTACHGYSPERTSRSRRPRHSVGLTILRIVRRHPTWAVMPGQDCQCEHDSSGGRGSLFLSYSYSYSYSYSLPAESRPSFGVRVGARVRV